MGFREAYGALKDSTTVNLAKVNSDYKDLDVAIVKATNHVEAPPKERHIRKIFAATSVVRSRIDAAYCIHALARRLAKTSNWIVAIKVLIVVHRTLREGDPFFRELLMNHSYRGRILHLANFKDDSGHRAWDCSAWVCTYALYLEERLLCFRALKFDIESERLTRASPGTTKVYSKTRVLSAVELLEQLPALQQLLYRLVGCEPRGLACTNYLIQYSLTLVLKESFKIYCAINDGIINLVDMFFDMPKHDAVKALGIYKRAGLQAEILADFYDFCKRLALARTFQFPTLRQPPSSFLATMEEYVKEAPQTGSFSKRPPDFLERGELEHKEETPEEEKGQLELEEEIEAKNEQEEPELLIDCESPLLISTDDLLGLNDIINDPKASEIEESNVPTVTIPSNGHDPQFSNTGLGDLGGLGWETALLSAPSNNTNPATESNLGGGLDKLLLDSLYEEDSAIKQTQVRSAGYGYGYGNGMGMQNPFEQQPDPFALSNGIAPPTNVQMGTLSQQPQKPQMFQQQISPEQETFQKQQMFQQPQMFQQQEVFSEQETFQQQQMFQQQMFQQQMFQQPQMFQQQKIFPEQKTFQEQQMFQQLQFQNYPLQHPQNINMMYYQSPSQYPRQQMLGVKPSNPFADPFPNFPSNTMPQHANP